MTLFGIPKIDTKVTELASKYLEKIQTFLECPGPIELKKNSEMWSKICPLSDISLLFYVLLTVHLSIFILVINQLDAQNCCFTISLFHASTCFEHMCSSSGGQNCIIQPLESSHL